ncbi:MAG: R3H domain-containing nucleic acid-binding protein [Chthoniobacterales bacterium]
MTQTPKEILDTILGYLGFVVEIKEMERDGTPVLQVYTQESEALIGRQEQVLGDLQFVVNRILHVQQPDAGRVIVDVEHHRDMRDDTLIQKAQQLAEAVRQSGRSVQTDPLNSYDRRIVHNAFKDDADLETWSPRDDARVKRVTIRLKRS